MRFHSFLHALACICLLNSPLALCQNAPAVHQHYVCNTGYTAQRCTEQMKVLSTVLNRYPAAGLGDWTWVLVRSEEWKPLKARLRGNPDSPAFSVLERHETFFEEALVSSVPFRQIELVKEWGVSMDTLLEIAVTHELGHALCREQDEAKADAYGRHLRSGERPHCR